MELEGNRGEGAWRRREDSGEKCASVAVILQRFCPLRIGKCGTDRHARRKYVQIVYFSRKRIFAREREKTPYHLEMVIFSGKLFH